ncbi:MAG: hypothetical protein B6242_10175 [Anaerolineaceae bacterium 4572_78]|nr:MAG: hypothetical protein B6242_10175 [Anaerolineaceae bacterium 4572_78]
MPIIKRYPNRKLYNTEAKEYITLDSIAKLIRSGEEVQVIDHSTGQDLTAIALTQIIFEQEKKHAGFLPHSVLTGLVKAGGDTLANLRRSLINPLKIFSHVETEIEHRIKNLVTQEELTEEEGQRLVTLLIGYDYQPSPEGWPNDNDIERVLTERGVPTRVELHQITEQLEVLSTKLDGYLAEKIQ